MELDLIDKGIGIRRSEGSECTCEGGLEGKAHKKHLEKIDASFKQDIERRKSAPTSETMRARVLSQRNGHH